MMMAILVIIVTSIIYTLFLYYDVRHDKFTGLNDAEERVAGDTKMTTIDTVYRFHGEDAYYVMFGETNEGDKQVAFVPLLNKEKELTVIEQQEIVSRESVKKQWYNECEDCDFIKITPGIIDDEPVWELTYVNEMDHYVIEYRSIYDGSTTEHVKVKQMFNQKG